MFQNPGIRDSLAYRALRRGLVERQAEDDRIRDSVGFDHIDLAYEACAAREAMGATTELLDLETY